MNGNICLHALATLNQKNGQLESFFPRILAVVCSGLWWFACITLVSQPIVPKSGGALWWFAVICGGLRWFAVVCGGLRWFAVVCLLVIPKKE